MKKFIAKVMIVLLTITTLLPVHAFASGELTFQLSVDGTGAAALVSNKVGADGVSSVQFSLTVNSANASDAKFDFSDEIKNTAKVYESRYHTETKTLNIYISGTNPLFGTDKTRLEMGKAVAYNSNQQVVTASFLVVQDSLAYVYGEELKKPKPTSTPVPPTPTPGSGSGGGGQPGPVTPSQPTPSPSLTPSPSPTPTETPTPTVTEPNEPQISSTMTLYIGGDVTGKYKESKYLTVLNRTGFTMEFASKNKKVAKVGKSKGKVTAVGVGTTTITATFKNKKTKVTIVRECKVTVKRNAVDAGLSVNSKKKLLKLTVGDSFQTWGYRKDSDGKRVWSGKKKITDTLRFTSSDKNIFTVDAKSGKVKAVGEGTATLTVWAVQTEGATYGKNGKIIACKATTKPRTYKVVVKKAK